MKSENQRMLKDMTVGKPEKLILLFALPIFLGNIFQQFYNIVDTIIAGRCLGDNSLAALGATSALYSLIIGMVNGMNNGYAIIVARAFGERSEKKIRDSVGLMILLNITAAIVVSIISAIVIGPILKVLKTPAEVYPEAHRYIVIILLGIVVTIFYNMEASVLRALGNSITPLIYLIIACVLNIGFDVFCVVVLKMGVAGLAVATVIAQLISVFLCLYDIHKNYPILHLEKSNFKIRKEPLLEMFTTGLSMGLMMSIFSIGTVILQSAINSLGTLTITAHLAARKVLEVVMIPLGTISYANSTFVSQNYGARKYERVREGIRKSCVMGMIWSAFSVVIIFLTAEHLVQFITSTKESYVIETATKYLHINVPFFFVLGVLFIFRTSLQGIGKKITPLISSTLELAGKIIATMILIPIWGYFGVCVVEPATWVVCTIWLAISYVAASRSLRAEQAVQYARE